ncbi:MAG: TonB-dependent receptor [Adhaeribacter sp.]
MLTGTSLGLMAQRTAEASFSPVPSTLSQDQASPARTKKAPDPEKKFLLRGTVRDSQTGATLVGATVFSPEANIGTTTDINGAFTLALFPGPNRITCSYLGFSSQTKEVNLNGPGQLSFQLERASGQLSEVQISGGRPADANVSSPQTGVSQLDMQTIQKMPAFLGEADVIKSIQLLPGVSTIGEAASGFNVRGGSPDQNLVLLDGAPVFNSSHVFGFFSVFNPNAVQQATLYRGGIPAQFGGRLSSVLEVKLKEGSASKFSGNGGLGLVSGRLALQGPLVKNKTSFLVAGRSSYSNWLLRKMPDISLRQSQATFYDVSAKISHTFGPRGKLNVSAYRSRDDFGFSRDTTYQWTSTLVSARYIHSFSTHFIGELSGAYSKYDFNWLNQAKNQESVYGNGIAYRHGKADFLYSKGPHQLQFGAGLSRYGLNPGRLDPDSPLSPVQSLHLPEEQGLETAFYLQEELVVSPRLALMAGLRYVLYGNYGPAAVYVYEPNKPKTVHTISDTLQYHAGQLIKSYQAWEPRFSLKYSLGATSSLKLGYNRNNQFLHQITNTAAISPTDFWKSSNSLLRPQTSDQVSLGYFRNFHHNMVEASVEGYYKHLQHVPDYKNGAELFLNPAIEADLLPARGRSYGLELSLQKNAGRLTGWMSYAYSRTLLMIRGANPQETVNQGAWYPANIDKPHVLNLNSQYQLRKRVSCSMNFTASTGRPITAPASQYVIGSYVVPHYGARNQYRIPAYHRLDVSLTIQSRYKPERKWEGSWNLSVYNLYGRKNPYSVFFKQVPGSRPQAYQLAVVGVPLPAFSYDFKF